VRRVPEVPGVPDSGDAVLRAANARLREQLAGLQSQVADLAARVKMSSQNSSRPPSSDGLAKPAPSRQTPGSPTT
jgi:hypothetical protein